MAAATQEPLNPVLLEKVTYPTFFEKAAAANISPTGPEDVDVLMKTAHLVGLAVSIGVDRALKAESQQVSSAIKSAADSAMTVAGLFQATAPAETKAAAFAEDPQIMAAARDVYAAETKKAGLADLLTPTKKVEEEDEEEGVTCASK